MKARVIRTSHDYPPIPIRSYDWSAVFDGYEPGEPIGRGASEAEAVAGLLITSDYEGAVEIANWDQRNQLIRQHAKQSERRFTGDPITGFGAFA